jgi:hypothetical protein
MVRLNQVTSGPFAVFAGFAAVGGYNRVQRK